MGWGKKVYVVCCDPGTKAALGKASSGADVRLMDAKNLPPAKAGDVQVVVTPVGAYINLSQKAEDRWALARNITRVRTFTHIKKKEHEHNSVGVSD